MSSLKITEIFKSIKGNKVRLLQLVGAVLVCAAILAAFIYVYAVYGKQLYTIFSDAEHLKLFLSRFQGYDKLAFVLVRAFQTVLKIIPAEPLEIGSGVLYGAWGGMFLCMAGTLIGSVVIIAISKLFGRRLVNVFFPIEKIDSLGFLKDKKRVYSILFLIYFLPGTPKDILTFAASITNINMLKFMLVTSIARIPSIITSTLCGQQIIEKNYWLALIIFVATAIAAFLCSFIYKKILSSGKHKSPAEENNDKEMDS